MAKQSGAQKTTVERVMHEFKHGELKSGKSGHGGKVKNPKQAIAIALHEAGASKFEGPKKNRENLHKTKAKERRGATAQQAAEGKGSIRRDAAKATHRKSDAGATTKAELYAAAKRRDIPGRSKMSKDQLARALHH